MTHFKFATVFTLGLTVGTLAAEAGDRSAGTRTGVAKSADPTFTITARSSATPTNRSLRGGRSRPSATTAHGSTN